MTKLGKGVFGCLVASLFSLSQAAWAEPPAEVLKDVYAQALAAEAPSAPPPPGVTGILVPHHLVAADLMARGFWAASSGQYDRIVVITPDHHRATTRPFAVAVTDLDTVFGVVEADDDGSAALLRHSDVFQPLEAGSLAREHGITTLAPFLRHFWPEAKLLAVVASISSDMDDWQAAAPILAALRDDRTLIVQSTDFSHYLPRAIAVLRDQESLGVIAGNQPGYVNGLHQPNHLDSRAALAIQMMLQGQIGASPAVIANRNQAEYGHGTDNTTSYITAIWSTDPRLAAQLDYPDQQVSYFGGDLLAGRFLEPILRNNPDDVQAAFVDQIRQITQGRPLAVNLEGVILPDRPIGSDASDHVMLADLAVPLLTDAGVRAAGLANNHARDFGALGLEMTAETLQSAGVTPWREAQVSTFGALSVLPLQIVGGHSMDPSVDPRPAALLQAACNASAAPPLVAFLHWSTEWRSTPSPQDAQLAERLSACGVSLIVGHHSHQASETIMPVRMGATQMVHSLGNLFFDQSGSRATSALLEVRVFEQSTVFARLVPFPNVFDDLRQTLNATGD